MRPIVTLFLLTFACKGPTPATLEPPTLEPPTVEPPTVEPPTTPTAVVPTPTVVPPTPCETFPWFPDVDGDGFGEAGGLATEACDAPVGFVADATDCDDTEAAISPAASESCNGLDDDCDGALDEEVRLTFFADADADGHGDPDASQLACDLPPGHVVAGDDCDDTDAANAPSLVEVCDGLDNNCDGFADEGVTQSWFADLDGDGFGAGVAVDACDAPPEHVADGTDCDDTATTRFPGNAELCDGLDNNCDDAIDDGLLSNWYPDADADGHGDAQSSPVQSCAPVDDHVQTNADCDDSAPDVNPDADVSGCDFVDTDCDGWVEERRVPLDYDTLQLAVDAAVHGDHICLDGGIFEGATALGDKALRISGTNGTILDGGGIGPVLESVSALTHGLVVIEDLTVQNGSGLEGAGIRLWNSRVDLRNVVVQDNVCAGNCKGTGLYAFSANLVLEDVEVAHNLATAGEGEVIEGAGVHLQYSTVTADRLTVLGNEVDSAGYMDGSGLSQNGGSVVLNDFVAMDNIARAPLQPRGSALRIYQGAMEVHGGHIVGNIVDGSPNAGGAIACLGSGTADFTNVLVADNATVNATTSYGAALYVFGMDVSMTNSTLANNSSTAPSTYGLAVHAFPGSTIALSNTDVSGTVGAAPNGHVRVQQSTITASYSNFSPDSFHDMPSVVGTAGNVSADPQLDSSYVPSPTGPLIDAGDPVILDPDGSRSDIGHLGGPGAQ